MQELALCVCMVSKLYLALSELAASFDACGYSLQTVLIRSGLPEPFDILIVF